MLSANEYHVLYTNPRGSRGYGERFCGEIALWSGATVFAADRLQWYTQSGASSTINFGAWEGQVYSYSPDSGTPTPVTLGSQPTSL